MTRTAFVVLASAVALLAAAAETRSTTSPADQPAAAALAATQPPAPPGRGPRRAVQVMGLSSPAWPEGGRIPARYTQAGRELSPPLVWDNVPNGVESFVLLVRDPHTAIGGNPDEVLHWLLWNIPGSARGLPEGVPHGDELPDGTRQISVSGPYYRGPGAPADGPAHHYVFELFALDAKLDVPAGGSSPAATRAAVMAAMAGHVIGKGAYVGRFRRGAAGSW